MYEIIGRLEQLQQEMQQLRGVVEEQSQTIANLKKRQSNIYSDLDQRLQDLADPEIQDPLADEGSERNSSVNLDRGGRNEQGVVEYPTPIPGAAKLSQPTNDTPVASQKQLYKEAYETLRNGHNASAIKAFDQLIAKYPEGKYADNSQYWLGEAYKANQDFKSAKKAFKKVVTDYSNSPKVADALLKLGYIEMEQKNMAKARDYLTKVTVGYPGTTAAHLAKKKLLQMVGR
jgi:tol-pal system protein YbgF